MRIILIIGGAAAAFFLAVAVLLSVVVDPNKYKGDIARLVQEQTGRELTFEGDVKLSFFPWLGLETGGVTLGNNPAFNATINATINATSGATSGAALGQQPFARVRAANISIRILPLLSRRVEAKKIVLDGLEVNLVRDDAGRANWADLMEPDAQDKPEDQGSSLLSLDDLSLDGVHVQNAALTWSDLQTGKRYAFSQGDLTLDTIRPGKPFDFKAAFTMASTAPELTARTEATGTATLNLPGERHIFSNIAMKVSATGKGVPGGKGEFGLGLAEFKIDMDKQTAQGTGLTFSGYGAKGTGQFLASNLKEGPDVKGRIDIPDFNGRELSAALTGKAPDTADAAAYQHITASLEFRTGRGYLEIPNFSAKLDDAVVEGRFRSTGLEQKAYGFNIRIQGLDVDRFLPAQKEGEAAREHAQPDKIGEKAGDKKDELFPMQTLRTMHLDGQISAERLKYRNLRFSSLKVPMIGQGGVLDVGPVEAHLYEGSLKAHLRVEAQGEQPQVSLSFNAVGIQGKPLFTDLKGRESEFAGAMHAETTAPLTCQGNSDWALKRSLNGRVRFSLRDGVFPGVSLVNVVQEGSRKAKSFAGSVAPASAEKSTKFGSIDGTAVITGGVAAINDLDLKAPFLRGEGKGTINIPTKEVNYNLRVRVVPNADGQGGGGVLDMLGLVVPLRVTGPYDNPTYGTDYLRSLGKGAVDAVGGVVGGAVDVVKGIGNVLGGKKKLF